MQQHRLIQGSPEWHAHRSRYRNASDAAAMMGVCPYKTRQQLLAEVATGIRPDVDEGTRRAFAEGHRIEALARPLADALIGDELYPVVGTSGRLSASFDGLTFAGDISWQHKSLNDALRAVMGEGATGADLPLHHQIQMEQECMVSGAARALFSASKWQGDELVEIRHCWYTPNPDLASQIAAGWDRLEADVAAYAPSEEVELTGRALMALPPLHIEVTGQVVRSNLAEYKSLALSVFASIKTELVTDQDFADAEAAARWCGDIEQRLGDAKARALRDTESLDGLLTSIDEIVASARAKRLDLDRQVKTRKDSARAEVVLGAQKALTEHLNALDAALGGAWMPRVPGGFAQVIKSRRSLTSCERAVTTELMTLKLQANATAERIAGNRRALQFEGTDWSFLFADFAALATKPAEDFQAIAQVRIQAHREATALATRPVPPAPSTAVTVATVTSHNSGAVPSAAADEPATLKLGEINERLAPLSVSVEALERLGFTAQRDRSARLYRPSQWPAICEAIAAYVLSRREVQLREPALEAA